MATFNEEEWRKRYVHRADYFANEAAFIDFGNATCHIRGLAVRAHHVRTAFEPEVLGKVTVAWAMQVISGQSACLRVYAPIPNENGEIQIYYDVCPLDFWTKLPEFKQIKLEEYMFKIERVQPLNSSTN